MTSKSIHSDHYHALTALLRELRESAKITQEELAEALGEDQSFVSKVERRERRLDIEELRRFCNAIGVSFIDFVATWERKIQPGKTNSSFLGNVPNEDSGWGDHDWKSLLEWFVEAGLVSYKDVTALTLGHLNPSQVGTSIASKKSFQKHFPPRKCWSAVRDWHFEQAGRCVDCGTRLELQADHVIPREELGDDADTLDNITLRCRRCNVVRRPSHKKGGLTFLTAEAALMWILFTKRPETYQEFEKQCREYGMTMANIRFQEAWAMAHWLSKEELYVIGEDSKY